MLTKEQNERFTRVGPGTPMGTLLRRYWLPFATVKQLHDHPTRAVTLLGEHLVAFRDRSGRYGLIQEYCPHRNVNLLWGIPEPEGLRCPYHGWLFDHTGNCLEQPAESPGSTFKDRIHVPAESDDPSWVTRSARNNSRLLQGAIGSGASGKYSPINQHRARRAGFAVPEKVAEAVSRVASYGQISPNT